ncbi:outer capsid protein [Bluetongue virus 3]|uniref:Outer capsid protein VP2 n=1 Tax=Bluetongue virus 3 TaxID=36423 RepID=A0A0U2QTQ7_BTV|nr:outer capsid protein [Bluetongue virus 3]ULT60652.1 outer capsid protein VP2 [Bluetongue virus 3]
MEELVIPVISRQFDKKLVGRYEYVIELAEPEQDEWTNHDVTQIPGRRMFDVAQQGIREAIIYKPLDNDGEVLPRILDMSIACYDMRKTMMKKEGVDFVSNTRWLEWMIQDSMDVQPLRVQMKEDHSTVQYDMFSAKVHIDSRKADTTSYHAIAVETKAERKCCHVRTEVWNSVVRNHLFNTAQESCYTFKQTYELIVNSERLSTEEEFRVGAPQFHTIQRNHRMQLGDNAYDKFLKGLVQLKVSGTTPAKIRDEVAALDVIRDNWIRGSFDRSHIKSLELCRLLSSIGRKMVNMEEEPKDEKDLSVKFQFKLDEKFSPNDPERNVIFTSKTHRTNEDRFYVLLVIAASDTNNGRVWWSNPYPCLRGALIAAECKLGDVYHTLRSKYEWGVRPTYKPKDLEREREKYVVGRVNLFDLEGEPATKVIHWEYELISPTYSVSNHKGNHCDLYPDDVEITTKFNEDRYREMIQSVIDDGWDQKNLKMYKILEEEGNPLLYDLEKDIKLDSQSQVVFPSYYNKWTHAPMFNARVKPCDIELAERKNDDPFVKRTLKPIKADCVDLLRYHMSHYYDLRPSLKGVSLSNKQTPSGIHQALVQDDLYSRLLRRRDVDLDYSSPCPIITNYFLLEKFHILILTIMEKHYWELDDSDDVYEFPKIDASAFEVDGTLYDISQTIVHMYDRFFEKRRVLRSIDESRWILHLIRISQGRERLEVIERFFPNYGKAMRQRDFKKVRDVMFLNFLPFFFLTGDNISYEHRQWSIPIILYADKLRILPIEVGAHYNRFGVTCILELLNFFPSYEKREEKLEEDIVLCADAIVNFYLQTTISNGGVQTSIVSTKALLYEMYLSSICGGYSEGVLWYLPITHPVKCLVALEVSDALVGADVRIDKIRRRFPLSAKHLKGIVQISVHPNRTFSVTTCGIVKHKVCKKTLLKHRCDVILLQTPGYVFGNDELLTKLLNI